jgi:hypothetical protein
MIQGAVFNVLDYGASPSASAATNTTAIQAAIDAANAAYTTGGSFGGGNTVFIPAGRYLYTGLIIKNGVNLVGAGMTLTNLALSGASSTGIQSPAAVSGLAADSIASLFRDLSLTSAESAPVSQVLLNAIGFTETNYINITFEWFGGCSSITMLNSTLAGSGGPNNWYNQLYSCQFIRAASRPAGGIAMQLGDTSGTKEQITAWTFIGGQIQGSGDGSGLQLRGTGVRFFGMTFQGCDTAVDIGSNGTRGATANTFDSCYWEGNTVNRQVRANAVNTMFIGSFVTGGTDTISNDSTVIIDGGQTRMWLPNPGEWQVTMESGVLRPQFISNTNFVGIDLVDDLGNNVSLTSAPQSSAANSYLNATYNGNTAVIWEAGTGSFSPGDDDLKTLGRPTFRWSTVYAVTPTINTSDERTKQQIQGIDPAVIKAWGKVNYSQFKFNDAVEKKGDGARWHIGLIAQKVKEAFESEGLDAFAYGLLCYDQWEDEIVEHPAIPAKPAKYDTDGNLVEPAQEGKEAWTQVRAKAGDRYGIRYEEALALECAYLRSKLG